MKNNILVFISLFVNLILFGQDGQLDTSFGDDGRVITNLGTNSDYGRSISIQSDGKIVVAGSVDNNGDFNFALVRYNSNGSLDATFGNNGIVIADFGTNYDYGYSVIIQPNNKIVVAGTSESRFAVVRFNEDGSLDSTFNDDGKVTTKIGTNYDYGRSIDVQPDGKIVVAGISNSGINDDFAVVRYNEDGSLDSTFNDNGKVTTNIGDDNDFGFSVGIQLNGKIVVAGISNNNNNYDFAVVRYNADGTLDTTFDYDGKVTTDIGGKEFRSSLAIQSDSKIVVAGYTDNDFAVVRYNIDGSLDTTFDDDGIVVTDFEMSGDYGNSVSIQEDGKIIVAGTSQDNFAIARYNANGVLDTTFNHNGKITTDFGGSEFGSDVAIQSDGNIVMAGYTTSSYSSDFALARYLPHFITSIETNSNNLIKNFCLLQNYPNPFNPSTNVRYNLPEQSNIKIEIFNMLGQSVKVLVNNNKSAGYYETTWNAENLPSGIYLISIRAEGLSSKKNFVQVKKALLLK